METALLIVSILLIIIVLLQGAKAEGGLKLFLEVKVNCLLIEKKEVLN